MIHFSTIATLYNSHLYVRATSLQWPPHLQWPPLYNGQLATMATSLQQPAHYNGHHSTIATSLQWVPLYNGH